MKSIASEVQENLWHQPTENHPKGRPSVNLFIKTPFFIYSSECSDLLADQFLYCLAVLHYLIVGNMPFPGHFCEGDSACSACCVLQHCFIYGPQASGEAVRDLPQRIDIIRQVRAERIFVVFHEFICEFIYGFAVAVFDLIQIQVIVLCYDPFQMVADAVLGRPIAVFLFEFPDECFRSFPAPCFFFFGKGPQDGFDVLMDLPVFLLIVLPEIEVHVDDWLAGPGILAVDPDRTCGRRHSVIAQKLIDDPVPVFAVGEACLVTRYSCGVFHVVHPSRRGRHGQGDGQQGALNRAVAFTAIGKC